MLRFGTVRFVYLFFFVALVICGSFFWKNPWWVYLLLLLSYSGIIAYGSAVVSSQFFMPVICKGQTTEKKVALSFDDGPAGESTDKVLQLLKQNNITATFFCIGKQIKARPEQLLAIHQQGHVIGNHTFSHAYLIDLYSKKKLEQELQDTHLEVKKIIGEEMNLFRPPYGVTTPNFAKAVKALKYTTIGWSIRTMDTVLQDNKQVIQKITNQLSAGDIILFHDSSALTVNSLQTFIDLIIKKGFTIVNIEELLKTKAYR